VQEVQKPPLVRPFLLIETIPSQCSFSFFTPSRTKVSFGEFRNHPTTDFGLAYTTALLQQPCIGLNQGNKRGTHSNLRLWWTFNHRTSFERDTDLVLHCTTSKFKTLSQHWSSKQPNSQPRPSQLPLQPNLPQIRLRNNYKVPFNNAIANQAHLRIPTKELVR
jgi:hypothetical protein